ncbi:MAG: cation:proton antiporter, partial [Candidatus Margulisiibacteriota bacterium]
AISSATAPAATVMVIQEMRASGNFTKTLLAIVAIDDGIALIIYGFASAISRALLSTKEVFSISHIMLTSITELGGSVIIGIIAGALTSQTVRRLYQREHILIVSMGALFVIIGLAEKLHISALLTCMSFGIYLTNFCPIASRKIFDTIKNVTPPIFIAFFVTAGAHLRIDLIPSIWGLGVVYMLARVFGKISGASLGAMISNADTMIKKYIGFGLLSQVGVAIGLALVVNSEFSGLGTEGQHIATVVINVLLTTTIFMEIIGPIMTRMALLKAGEGKIPRKHR